MGTMFYRLMIRIGFIFFFWTSISHALVAHTSVQLSSSDQGFSANFEHTPLIEVMQELSDKLGITVTVTGGIEAMLISSTFIDLPLEKAVEQLLLGQDYALFYARENRSDESIQMKKLKEIVVLPRQSTRTTKAQANTANTVLTSRHDQPKIIDSEQNVLEQVMKLSESGFVEEGREEDLIQQLLSTVNLSDFDFTRN